MASGLFAQTVEEQEEYVRFDRKDGAPSQIRSEMVYLGDDGLAVVITETAAIYTSGTYNGEPVELIAHDTVSRLSLVKIPATSQDERSIEELGKSLDLEPGALLYREEGDASEISRVVSRATSYKDAPLPLELLRVAHPEGTKLVVGHPFHDSAGRLIGINYRKVSEFGNGSFVFPVEAIKYLLEAPVENKLVQRSWFGVELLPSDPFAVIRGVRPDSPASTAGLLTGDVLIGIGSRKIANYADAINAFYYLREGQEESVSLLRGTELMKVTVTPRLVPSATSADVTAEKKPKE